MAYSMTFLARGVWGSRPMTTCSPPGPCWTIFSTSVRILRRSMSRFLSTLAATPEPSLTSPSRMCSVPMYSWLKRWASWLASCITFRARSVKRSYMACSDRRGVDANMGTPTNRRSPIVTTMGLLRFQRIVRRSGLPDDGRLGFADRRAGCVEAELLLAAVVIDDLDGDGVVAVEGALEEFLGERVFEVLLDGPAQRPGAEVEARSPSRSGTPWPRRSGPASGPSP